MQLRQSDLGALRRIVVTPYVVLYTFQAGKVTVVRVLHGARGIGVEVDKFVEKLRE
jgi:plasmid stabilization system protein ParE